MEGYHSPQVAVSVRLNTNESPFPPPPGFVEEWLDELRATPLHRYPDRSATRLREALGAHLGQPAERVFAANGSNEVLQTLLLTYGGPGRRVLLFEPSYLLHAHIARICGTEVVTCSRSADFTLDADAAAQAVAAHDPDVVIVCSPNNPTGLVEPRATVEAILDAAPRALGIVDEAYAEFSDWSALELVRDDRPLVVTRTYSKVFSLAAIRLGFCVAPPSIIVDLEKVALPYRLSVPTQVAGTLALRRQTDVRSRLDLLVRERDRVAGAMRAMGGIEVFPSGANFILFRPARGGRPVWDALLEQGVLVRDFSSMPLLAECLRVTIGTEDENGAFLAALEEAR